MSESGQIEVSRGSGEAALLVGCSASGGDGFRRRLGQRLGFLGPNVGAVVGFLLIVIAGTLVSDVFLSWTNVRNVFLQSAMLGVVALGMTFVILTGGIDCRWGASSSLCSVVAAMMFANGEGFPLPIVFFATMALGAAIGAIRRHHHLAPGGPFIVTLAMMGIALGSRDRLGRQTDRRHQGDVRLARRRPHRGPRVRSRS